MTKTIIYIARKRLPNYHSIEELFLSIRSSVKKTYPTQWQELQHHGATPASLFKNLRSKKKEPLAVYHITGGIHYMALKYRKRAILTIHDVNSGLTGSFIKRAYVWLFWFWLPALFVRKITVISEFTKTELSAIIPLFKSKISVIHNPVHQKIKASIKEFNAIPNILLLGTKSNKNLERSLQAIKDISCNAVIVGPLSPAQKLLITSLRITYTHKQNMPFNAIITCYQEADIVCFPSLYEGFGMPIIEAQATGRVVLTSNIGAMKEIAGLGAHLVNPLCIEDIKAGIERIISDAAYREGLIANGFKNVSNYSLEKKSDCFLELYKQF
jgi:glycosyltransferase involved in cell wall biosynthesis